ncbi:uncharacterized protein LOC108679601 [Hyalella azteca]|uniref:Uncharacterized protein LOC108679601 n=1 Tax=Hyalella azteca TaxID=294128 RepID=A0A8B7PC54_HYAAZ|nr:uncharacterized protein LOC108679601 [Hyalella azteca]
MSFSNRIQIRGLHFYKQMVKRGNLFNLRQQTCLLKPSPAMPQNLSTSQQNYINNSNYFSNYSADNYLEKIQDFGKKYYKHRFSEDHIEEICQKFLNVGVKKEDLIHAFCQMPSNADGFIEPHVFKLSVSQLERILLVFINHNISPEAMIRVIMYYGSDILSLSPQDLEAALMALGSLPHLDKPMTQLLHLCPQLIEMDKNMEEKLDNFRDIFPQKELKHLFKNSPNVLLDSWKTTWEKISYIYEEMGLDQPHISYNNTLSFSLQHIKERHEAMLRTGVYKKPKLHRDRLSHLMNVKLDLIMNSSDAQFCKQILGIPLEDYISFLELMHRERGENFHGIQMEDYEADEAELQEKKELRDSYGRKSRKVEKEKKDYQRWLSEQQ